MNLYSIKSALFTILLFTLTGCGISVNTQNNQIKIDHTVYSRENDNSTIMNEKNNLEGYSDRLVRIQEQNLSYIVNNEIKEETAFLKNNDNQNYSMYVLPNYELFAEEPKKDILQLTKDHSIFMRIELLPNDVDWSILNDATIDQFTAVSKEIPVRIPIKGDLWKEKAIHEVNIGQDTVTVYFIDHKDIKIRLTMYTNKNEDHRSAFYQMAKTILKEAS
jgi:hypothetical protein